ncbi:MAG: PDZ domain-containing protein [candidate division Zixibacteria bacterium]|nr:PDZ domain-containing protein [candidate division Zixibacteria bacterium]
MNFTKAVILGFVCIVLQVSAAAQDNTPDPYDILNRYFEAMGGLDRLKAEKSFYFDADFEIAGLKGIIKVWNQQPGRSHYDVDVGILKIKQGENDEYEWILDQNGKLQKITNFDDATIMRKDIKRRIERYEYTDPKSDIFTVTYKGIQMFDDKDCHTVKVTNNICSDNLTYYINIESYLPVRIKSIEGVESNNKYFRDYREIDGLMVAFEIIEISHNTGQDQTTKITNYMSNPEIDYSIFEAPPEPSKDYRFETGDMAEYIPMRFIEEHIFVPVMIDCKETIWILDTGASVSVISDTLAEKLDLELEGDMKAAGAGGQVDIKFTVIPSYSIPGIVFDEQTVAVINMDELNTLLAYEIDGILGFDFLARFVTKIDYANEYISIYDPETFTYAGDGAELGFHLKENMFMVEAALDDTHKGNWLADLGSSMVSIHGTYALVNRFPERKGVESLGHGASNYFRIKNVKFKSLDFAGFRVDNPIISFSIGGTDTVFTADEIGTLGNPLFKHFVLYCDYAGERLIVEKGDNFNVESPEGKAGMGLSRGANNEIMVARVSANTPAAKAGFEEDDIILKINGIEAGCFDGLLGIRRILRERAGTKYEFIVGRDGQERKLNIKLANLY